MSTYTGTTRIKGKGHAAEAAAHSNYGRAATTALSGKAIKLIAIALFAVFVLVGLQAYTATLQHTNNVLQSENEYLQAEIDSLNSQIVEETKITKIEKTATKKYGMVYPTSENCITIEEDEPVGENLAATIRGEAYN